MTWNVMLEPSRSVVPAGNYLARLVSVEASETSFGSAALWKFEVIGGGEHKGKICQHTTADRPTPKNNLTRLLQGMLGHALEPNKPIDMTSFVGQSYIVMVEQTAEGRTRVASVMPAPKD